MNGGFGGRVVVLGDCFVEGMSILEVLRIVYMTGMLV